MMLSSSSFWEKLFHSTCFLGFFLFCFFNLSQSHLFWEVALFYPCNFILSAMNILFCWHHLHKNLLSYLFIFTINLLYFNYDIPSKSSKKEEMVYLCQWTQHTIFLTGQREREKYSVSVWRIINSRFEFTHWFKLVVIYWNLIDSLFPQVSRTHLSILVDVNNAVIWMVSILPLIYSSFRTFPKLLRIVPSTPNTTNIMLNCIFHYKVIFFIHEQGLSIF